MFVLFHKRKKRYALDFHSVLGDTVKVSEWHHNGQKVREGKTKKDQGDTLKEKVKLSLKERQTGRQRFYEANN